MLDILHILHRIHRMPCKSLVQPFDLSALWCDISAHWSSSSSMTFKSYREHWYIYIFWLQGTFILSVHCTYDALFLDSGYYEMEWHPGHPPLFFFIWWLTYIYQSLIISIHRHKKIQENFATKQRPVCCSIHHWRQVLWRASLVLLTRSRPMLLLAFTKCESTSCLSTENKPTQFS